MVSRGQLDGTRILGFTDRSRYFFFQAAPQLYTHEVEWTPFQTHYFSEKLLAPGIEPGTSRSVAKNSDHQTTEAVNIPALLNLN
jgi:hypothetical protein